MMKLKAFHEGNMHLSEHLTFYNQGRDRGQQLKQKHDSCSLSAWCYCSKNKHIVCAPYDQDGVI